MTTQVQRCIALLLGSTIIYGCSGDEIIGTGNDDKIVGLKLPTSINVVPPTVEAASTTLSMLDLNQAVFSDQGTDYSNDSAEIYFTSTLQSATDGANSTLCFLNSLKLDLMVNKGPYKAILTKDPCIDEEEQQNTWSTAVKFTVLTERKDNHSPQTFTVWETYKFDDAISTSPVEVIFDGEINANVSDVLPFGDFAMTYKFFDYSIDDPTGGSIFVSSDGFFKAAVNENNTPRFLSADIVNWSNSTSTGNKIVSTTNITLDQYDYQKGSVVSREESDYKGNKYYRTLAGQYDSDFVLQGTDADQDDIFESTTCTSRNEYEYRVSNYSLYHEYDGMFRGRAVTAGNRIDLMTELTVAYQDTYITVGYDNDRNGINKIPDGATVTTLSPTAEELTFYTSPGKLKVVNSTNIPLANLEGRVFRHFNYHPNSLITSAHSWLVRVTDNEFVIEGIFSNTGKVTKTIDHDNDPATAEISVLATIVLKNKWDTLSLFDLNEVTSYFYQHDVAVAVADRIISESNNNIHLLPSDQIFSDGPVTMYCYDRCLKGGIDQTMVDNAVGIDDLYHTYLDFVATPFLYTISNENHKIILTDLSNGQSVDFSGLVPTSTIRSFDLMAGSVHLLIEPLPEPATFESLLLTQNSFRWYTNYKTTGHTVTLVDSAGMDVVFDRPISISYQHDAANDRSNTDPATNPQHGIFYTFSNGKFPTQIDAVGNYSKPFSVLDGTQMSNGEGDYIVKARQIEQHLVPALLEECSGLNINNIVSNPLLALPTEEDVVPMTLTPSDKPAVSGPPSIIDGVIQ